MYTLIVYTKQNKVIDFLKSELEPEVKGNDVYMGNASYRGIETPFIVIDQEVEVSIGMDVSPLIPLDKKDVYIGESARIQKELQETKETLAFTQQILNEMMLGG